MSPKLYTMYRSSFCLTLCAKLKVLPDCKIRDLEDGFAVNSNSICQASASSTSPKSYDYILSVIVRVILSMKGKFVPLDPHWAQAASIPVCIPDTAKYHTAVKQFSPGLSFGRPHTVLIKKLFSLLGQILS